jgi:hypothetical protein
LKLYTTPGIINGVSSLACEIEEKESKSAKANVKVLTSYLNNVNAKLPKQK